MPGATVRPPRAHYRQHMRVAPQLQEQDLEPSFDPAIPRLGLCLTDMPTRVLNDVGPVLPDALFVEAKD